MSEEMFYGKVKEVLGDFAPEVPAYVYTGIRRKLWLSRFLRFSPERLNLWYLLLITVGVSISITRYVTQKEISANKAAPIELNLNPLTIPTTDNHTTEPLHISTMMQNNQVQSPSTSVYHEKISPVQPLTEVSEKQNSNDADAIQQEQKISPEHHETTEIITPLPDSHEQQPTQNQAEQKKGKMLNVKVFTDKK